MFQLQLFVLNLSIYYAIQNTSAQNLSKINAMINLAAII
jgi:hypothetical protein